jgi:uncharacterized protein YxeA
MKKQMKFLTLFILLITAVFFTVANAQQDKKNKKDQQQQNQAKKENPGQLKKAEKNKVQPGQQKDKQDKGNANNNRGNNNNGNNGRNASTDVIYDEDGKYKWNRESFKERDKIRKQDKVTICHKFNNNNEPAVTINVSANALKAHMNHGDVMGDCPETRSSNYSDGFLRSRKVYYNDLQNTQEQVIYSRSILDYAVQRLGLARTQLGVMQQRGLPAAEIERKQATVVELEQNVSLLETLIGVAAGLVVNKWQ